MKVSELFETISFAAKNGRITHDMYDLTVEDDFNMVHKGLTTLAGMPKKIGGYFSCSDNKLTSLEGCPKDINGDFFCYGNNLTSLHNIHKMINNINGGSFVASINPIKECVLGLLKIKKLKSIACDNKQVQDIINKYLPEGDIIECQAELIEAGYEEYAKL
jgi:hypothetical protein